LGLRITAFPLFLIMGMGARTDEFVVAVGKNLWLWFHSMQLFQNIE